MIFLSRANQALLHSLWHQPKGERLCATDDKYVLSERVG